MSPLWQLTLARLREFFRRPAAVFWVYGFPLGLALILGAAFSDRPADKVRVDVRTDGPGGPTQAEAMSVVLLKDARVQLATGDEATTRNRLRTAKTDLVVTPGRDLNEAPTYLFEPNRPECGLARTVADVALMRRVGTYLPPTEVTLDEPGGRYIDFLIPGLLGINLMGGGLWGVGFVVVDMRVRKLLKRFLATPMRRTDFLLALMLSRLIFTLIEIVLLLTFSYLVFDIRLRGDPTAFAALVVVGGAAFAGVGLLVASRAETIETVSGLMNAVMLPMYLLSGVFFASDRFPEAMQPVIQLLPLTALNEGLRAVMNDGAGWSAAARPLAIMAAWGVACYVLAFRLFRWR